MNVQTQLQMDNAAFLDWVQGRDERYELAEGPVMMMTGTTLRHGLAPRPRRNTPVLYSVAGGCNVPPGGAVRQRH